MLVTPTTRYEDLIDALRERRVELQINPAQLDCLLGMKAGTALKLEQGMQGGPGRSFGPIYFTRWLGALGVGIILIDVLREERGGAPKGRSPPNR